MENINIINSGNMASRWYGIRSVHENPCHIIRSVTLFPFTRSCDYFIHRLAYASIGLQAKEASSLRLKRSLRIMVDKYNDSKLIWEYYLACSRPYTPKY